jgi:hypothetical protein
VKTFTVACFGMVLSCATALAQQRLPETQESISVHITPNAVAQNTQAPLPPPTPVAAAAPPTITLHERHGHVNPIRHGFTHTGAGNIDVAQPAPDTLIVTMTGAAVAGGHPTDDSFATLEFDLEQYSDITAADPNTRLKVSLEARAIGLLRSHSACRPCKPGKGSAEMGAAHVALASCAGPEAISVSLEPHAVGGGDNLSINDHSGPVEAPIVPGKYVLHQKFSITAAHARSVLPCKAASAEFAPDPALDPLWISYREPFHGANKKDFGFQIILKVVTSER